MEMNESASEDETIEEWSAEMVRKRSQELQLIDENGQCIVSPPSDRSLESVAGDDSAAGRDSALEIDDGSKSASTTSDSQITVRSSPIAKKIDKLSVCRHCHKNCRQRIAKAKTNSLKVQHSQSSSSRCCPSTNSSSPGSQMSSSSRTSGCSKAKLLAEDDVRSSPGSARTLTTNTCSCRCCRCTQEVKKETCRIFSDVSEVPLRARSHEIPMRESKIGADDDTLLVGQSQFHPVASDPFNAVPQISIVPPTPDEAGCLTASKLLTGASVWDAQRSQTEVSPEDSPQDELPYRVLNTPLKRFGTMSSLEKLPSEDTDDRTYDSSETEANEDDGNALQSSRPQPLYAILNAFRYQNRHQGDLRRELSHVDAPRRLVPRAVASVHRHVLGPLGPRQRERGGGRGYAARRGVHVGDDVRGGGVGHAHQRRKRRDANVQLRPNSFGKAEASLRLLSRISMSRICSRRPRLSRRMTTQSS